MQTIQQFYNYNKNNNYKNKTGGGGLSETSAVIIDSVEKERLGTVAHASNTVQSLFHISKEELLGQKINVLMPTFIAKSHDWWMQKYLENSITQGIDKKINSYGKTMDNALMKLEVNLKVYPYLDKGINMMAYIRQTALESQTLIVNPDGIVAEMPEA